MVGVYPKSQNMSSFKNIFLQLAKDTEYNWVIIEAIQGFQ